MILLITDNDLREHSRKIPPESLRLANFTVSGKLIREVDVIIYVNLANDTRKILKIKEEEDMEYIDNVLGDAWLNKLIN